MDYCAKCKIDNLPCSRGLRGLDGNFCKNKQFAMQSPEGSAFLDLIKNSSADIKVGGMGTILGFDTHNILRRAELMGMDLTVVNKLLDYANAGLLKAVKDNKD